LLFDDNMVLKLEPTGGMLPAISINALAIMDSFPIFPDRALIIPKRQKDT
jgi:hypothetical protein